ncbi:thiol-disulfide oxidoreductase DCC family protein [Lederbergia wuyishanensis]|uniref:DCC family thiol-disulfide oxidoreductase YuxK n=1 Tax=Lederbergia wuyishanensis TaxID=1347903 RepID=A0ABU0CYK0_9BACI|nr:thiol-disulfide oxidoreductase DCC family protein [Lederbergia wuyishanensis]MCJ8005863.1 thiol-disulfide oxidoreductase DCC family protein [Lederbergia wuyishanensis]MDQ0341228.1 putative DCC family thiol-disulfide oxidoreductase YuxK [Lederbergia wuyishanensis]
MSALILFDGTCNFCNSSVQFIIKRDPHGYFKYASLQSELGQSLIKKHGVPLNVDSLVLIENNVAYLKTTAALRICKKLNSSLKWLYLLIVIPSPIRDLFYNIFAKYRYKWFGKNDSCMLPPPEIRKRFL